MIQEWRDPKGRVLPGNKLAAGPQRSKYAHFEEGIAEYIGVAISPLDTPSEKATFRQTLRAHVVENPLAYYRYVFIPALKLFPPKVLERVIDRIFPPLELEEDAEDLKVLREIVEREYKGGKSLDEIERDIEALADAEGGEGHP